MQCHEAQGTGGSPVAHICTWGAAPDGGVAMTGPDMAQRQYVWDLATVDMTLPAPGVVAQSVLGALSTDGTSIVWLAGTHNTSMPTLLLRLSPSDNSVPVQVAMLNDYALATTISAGTVYFSTAGATGQSSGTISSVALSGGTAQVIVPSQTIIGNSGYNGEWFIQTDGTTLYWTTASSSLTATGTIASAPIAGPTATVLVNNVAVPTGLLRANNLTYYTSAGTSAVSFHNAVVSTVGGQPIDSGVTMGDVHSDGAGGILYIRGGAIWQLPAGATAPRAVYSVAGSSCQTSYCATALAVAPGGTIYFAGSKGGYGSVILNSAGTPIASASTYMPQPITTLVFADGALYWVETQTGKLLSYKP
jgi:hypothetical protein